MNRQCHSLVHHRLDDLENLKRLQLFYQQVHHRLDDLEILQTLWIKATSVHHRLDDLEKWRWKARCL